MFLTVEVAQAAYVAGRIDVATFEREVAKILLRGEPRDPGKRESR